MKNRFLALLLALALSPTPIVLAQAGPTPPAAAPADKPGPRLLTPEEKRDNVSPHDNARPEGTITPQINIPLGKKPTTPQKPERGSDPLSRRPPPPAIDDSAARCSALVDAAERASCFDRHSRARARQ
ncbi:MAG: hypothetical protein WCJ87_00165 [Burkholderiales bacterium]